MNTSHSGKKRERKREQGFPKFRTPKKNAQHDKIKAKTVINIAFKWLNNIILIKFKTILYRVAYKSLSPLKNLIIVLVVKIMSPDITKTFVTAFQCKIIAVLTQKWKYSIETIVHVLH